MITCEIFSHVYFAKPPESLSCAYLDSHVRFGFQGLNWASKVNVGIRAVTSSGHQEERRVFWVGLKIIEICPIFSNYIQHIFAGEVKNYLGVFASLHHPWLRAWSGSDRVWSCTFGPGPCFKM